MIPFGLRKYKRKLSELYREKAQFTKTFEQTLEEYGCSSCEKIYSGAADSFADRFKNCDSCKVMSDVLDRAKQCDVASEEVEKYIVDNYAKAVFEFYQKKKPILVRKQTKEQYTWDQAFGSDFEAIPKTLRYALIGLVEGNGRYELK